VSPVSSPASDAAEPLFFWHPMAAAGTIININNRIAFSIGVASMVSYKLERTYK
jgi:hypothetical protein